MKRILLSFILLISFTQNAKAQCGANFVAADPQPLMICEGSSETITFSAGGQCSGSYEFQVLIGGTEVQAWSTTSTFAVSPTSLTTYTVNARCSACPTAVVTADFIVDVTEQPSIAGNLFICSGETTTLSASGTAAEMSWWDSETGGSQLSSTTDYTTPPLTANTSYWMHASNTTTTGSGGSVLITECGTEGYTVGSDADYIEISNLYSTAVNTTGWVVAVSSSYTAINSVNSTLWYLPSSFAPCSVVSKTDVSSAPNYWGSNIFWNPNNSSWAIIIDNNGNVVDFIAWGWSAAQLASFNPTINGFSITLGPEWTGAGCPSSCSAVGNTMYSYSRTGNADNNNAGDFTCQATSVDVVNPGLSCGWSASASCPYETVVIIDTPPTASNPATISVQCSSDVPSPNVNVVLDEADDYTSAPVVTFLSDVSDGNTCPEIITRTYRVADSCTNYIDVTQIIRVRDTIAPVLENAPADVTVQCSTDIPTNIDLNWTDNCDGSGVVSGIDVSNGASCPEVITRSWTYTDNCGNAATKSQLIIIDDTTPPVADPLPAAQLLVLPPADPSVLTGVSDNCSTPIVTHVIDVTDGGFCPEIVTRTYSVMDDCGNETLITQDFMIGDPFPEASFIASEYELTNLETEVDFTNMTTGAATYVWDFGDGTPTSTLVNPTHTFPDEEGGGYLVQLIAFSPFGCSDTIEIAIKIREEVIYYIPNSFTPDDDEFNQTFSPVFYSGIDIYSYEMQIFNRWGEMIFVSHDPSIGWDGTYNGTLVADGNYIWKIRFKVPDNDERIVDSGSLTLFK